MENFLNYVYSTAKEYYDEKTFHHAKRVAHLVKQNDRIKPEDLDNCIALALMHDLLEDTSYDISELDKYDVDDNFKECLRLLTKDKHLPYTYYIINIRNHMETYPNAFWVKLADIEDHLLQSETLTDRLKEKYLKAIPYFVMN